MHFKQPTIRYFFLFVLPPSECIVHLYVCLYRDITSHMFYLGAARARITCNTHTKHRGREKEKEEKKTANIYTLVRVAIICLRCVEEEGKNVRTRFRSAIILLHVMKVQSQRPLSKL